MKKKVLSIVAVVLVLCCAIGGTLAWLTAKTAPVKNTFTTSDIKIKLEESKDLNLKMVPGFDIKKDPQVWVEKGSEECYLFVKLEKGNDFDKYMTYKVDTTEGQWTRLTGEGITGEIYYRVVSADDITAETHYSVLKGDKVTVRETVTKEMMNSLTAETYPTLTVTAYASQLYKNSDTTNNTFSALEAWNNANPTPAP